MRFAGALYTINSHNTPTFVVFKSSLQTKVWQQIAGLVPLATDFLLIDIHLLIHIYLLTAAGHL
ncbi:Methionine aminopeptidase [Yersinia enterocolitica]|nr:Methionine aminopeptidase [Yersinia enterocolitica]